MDEPTQRFGQGDAYFGGCGFILQHLQVLLYVGVIRIVAQQADGRDTLVRRQGRVGNALVVALYAGKLGGDTFQNGGLFFWCIQPVGGGIVVFYGFLYGTLWEEGQPRAQQVVHPLTFGIFDACTYVGFQQPAGIANLSGIVGTLPGHQFVGIFQTFCHRFCEVCVVVSAQEFQRLHAYGVERRVAKYVQQLLGKLTVGVGIGYHAQGQALHIGIRSLKQGLPISNVILAQRDVCAQRTVFFQRRKTYRRITQQVPFQRGYQAVVFPYAYAVRQQSYHFDGPSVLQHVACIALGHGGRAVVEQIVGCQVIRFVERTIVAGVEHDEGRPGFFPSQVGWVDVHVGIACRVSLPEGIVVQFFPEWGGQVVLMGEGQNQRVFVFTFFHGFVHLVVETSFE